MHNGVNCFRRAERDTAQYPVNQRIISGEPVVSQDCGAASIQQSYIELNGVMFPRRETDQEVNGVSDFGVRGAVEKS